MAAKFTADAVSWYESGRLAAVHRRGPGIGVKAQAGLASSVGGILGIALAVYAAHRYEQPLVTGESLLIMVLATVVPGLVVLMRRHFGRSIALASDRIVRIHPGSRSPGWLYYDSIDYCAVRTMSNAGDCLHILDVFGENKRLDEIELPDDDVERIVDFLAARGVRFSGPSRTGR